MTFKVYQEQAKSTCADLGSIQANILHMAVGVSTELGELSDAYKKHFAYGKPLDIINVKEEIGDACWYLANWLNMVDQTPTNLDRGLLVLQEQSSVEHICKACLFLQSTVLVGMSDYNIVIKLWLSMQQLCIAVGIDFEDCLQANINKLKSRYKENTFTPDEAIKRNLDSERAVLEE